jgi:hypothetical protein
MDEKTEIIENEEVVVDASNVVETTEETTEVNKATVKNVDLPEEDSSDITAEETIEMSKPIDANSEEVKKINEEQKDYLLKRAKEAEIDWDSIIYEEDGVTPVVTNENIEVFSAFVSDFIDPSSMYFYVEQARDAIHSYFEMKDHVESGDATTDDLEYYKACTTGYEDARIVLAMIQVESSRLEKEFNESGIAEDFIKGITLKNLRDYIVERFRFNRTWCKTPENIEDLDDTKEIEDSILKTLFVTTMFKKTFERYRCKAISSKIHNIFGKKFISDFNTQFIKGIQSYINCIPDKNNIDIKTVITRDFKALDFVNAVILFAMIEENDPIVADLTLSEEEMATLKSKLNPNNYFTCDENDNIYKNINKLVNKIIDKLLIAENLNKFINLSFDILKSDPLHNKIMLGIDLEAYKDYPEYIARIATFFPEINGIRIMEWGKVYAYMNKYETYITYYNLKQILSDPEISDKDKRKGAFNTVKSIMNSLFMFAYGDFISTLTEYIKENVYSREPRPLMFTNIIRNVVMQHEFGFKADFTPTVDDSGEVLYEKAKTSFGKEYRFMIGKEKDDILLKDVNLTDTRKAYIDIVYDMCDLIDNQMDEIIDDSYVNFIKAFEQPAKIKKPRKHNKSRKAL